MISVSGCFSLVQIVATGVCHTDLYHLFEGMHKDGFPVVLGHEGAGIVESTGPGVTEFQPGQLKFKASTVSSSDRVQICDKMTIHQFPIR